jgi:hypothetical protein
LLEGVQRVAAVDAETVARKRGSARGGQAVGVDVVERFGSAAADDVLVAAARRAIRDLLTDG